MTSSIKNQIKKLMEDASKLRKGGLGVNKYEEDGIFMELLSLADENPEIMKEVVRESIESLREEVTKHDMLYSENKPIITDSEYDCLYLKLEKLERENPEFYDENSPTQKIITTVVSNLEKIRHRTPMLSQQKITTEEEVVDFCNKNKGTILVQDKLDGITIVLSYENGRLVEAVSRGDGEIGENLLHNARHLVNLPKVIPFKGRLEARAEAILPYKDFDRINIDGKYSNPRNLVSGSLRQLDSSNVQGKGFKAIMFDLIFAESMSFENDVDMLEFLKEQGFETVETRAFKEDEVSELLNYIRYYEEHTRKILPFMIDGLVLKVDNITLREELGYTSKYPRWACAYKFKSMDATTKLIGITDQVGKTGQITPVAELETVNIDGVNISRATLHNYGNIEDKDIRINDTVVVARANDVIPQIVQSVKDLRDGSEVIKEHPKNCPICGAVTEFDGANLYCTGLNCEPQLEGKLKHYASRGAMNIDGMGEKTVEEFFQRGIVNTIPDIYKLQDKEDEICSIEGFGKKKYERLINGVEESKDRGLNNLIYGLSIKNIGESASKDLAKEFKSMESIIEASKDIEEFRKRLLTVRDFGEIMSQCLIDFFLNEENVKIVQELISLGVNSKLEETESTSQGSLLEGQVFVVTGDVNHFKNRKELQAKIESLGGKVSGSVSKNTNYLINNDIESNSSKNKKAKELNVPIITEEDFLNLIK